MKHGGTDGGNSYIHTHSLSPGPVNEHRLDLMHFSVNGISNRRSQKCKLSGVFRKSSLFSRVETEYLHMAAHEK